ncbi:MAG TPA: AI-2E family transporter [Xanthobacteraceae bacterium]
MDEKYIRREPSAFSSETFLIAVLRAAFLGLLGYWVFVLIRPFLLIILWSVILTVALYPAFDYATEMLGGRRRLAAAAITFISLLIMLGPATWLGLSLADSIRWLIGRFGNGGIAIPPPVDWVKTWPLVGPKIYDMWQLASTNVQGLIVQISPQLKPIGARILGVMGGVSVNLIKFIMAVVISGFLFVPGRTLVISVKASLRRLATKRGEEFADLAGATVRTVSRGVIGVASLQALLAGIGFLLAGVSAPGLLSFLVLLLGIVQIGPTIIIVPAIIWYWFTRDPMPAFLFTAYMVPVNLLDNVLRPILITRGLNTPMPVIFLGVLGGTIAHGLIGLFVGPIILAIAWQLLVVWTREETSDVVSA